MNQMTMEELFFAYEEFNRKKAVARHQTINNEEGFFGRFQKSSSKIEAFEPKEEVLIFSNYVDQKSAEIKNEFKVLDDKIAYHHFMLRHERNMTIESSVSTHYASNDITRYHVDCIKDLEKQKEKLTNNDPVSWFIAHEDMIKADLYNTKKKRMVEVPYVKQAKDKIIDAMDGGTPVYLVGHLGSGKTQLAVEAAIDFTIANRMQEELEEGLNAWFKKNPNASDEEAFFEFVKQHDARKKYYDDLLDHGSHEEREKIQPLFISGSHNLTYEDMFVEKTLTLSKGFEAGEDQEYLNEISKNFDSWRKENKEFLQTLNVDDRNRFETMVWNTLSDVFVAKNSSFGTTVEKIEREILIALKEGRPVIIDELNTIAMQNLIALNDILQHRAGSNAYVTGVGSVRIQRGFALIGTGNLSTDTVQYEGTNRLNPAFQSRFITVEYNYVHENMIGSIQEETNMEENELYRLIVEYLLEEDGTLFLPDIKHSLEELFNFASLASLSQQVFMGRWNEKAKIDLKEAVLSIRNVIHVLDHYNHGESEDLSMALWNGFLSSITNGGEQNYLLNQAVRFGFFSEEDGWKIPSLGIHASPVTLDEIRVKPYNYQRKEVECFALIDVVHLLFGKGVPFKEIPEELKGLFSFETAALLNEEEVEQLIHALNTFKHTIDVASYIEKELHVGILSDDDYTAFIQGVNHLEQGIDEIKENGVIEDDIYDEIKEIQVVETSILDRLVPYAVQLEPFFVQNEIIEHNYDVYELNDRLILPQRYKEAGELLHNKLVFFRNARGSEYITYLEHGKIRLEGYKDGRLVRRCEDKTMVLRFDAPVTGLCFDQDDLLYVAIENGDVLKIAKNFTGSKVITTFAFTPMQIAVNKNFILGLSNEGKMCLKELKGKEYEVLLDKELEGNVEQIAAVDDHAFVYVNHQHKMVEIALDRVESGEQVWKRKLYQ